MTLNTEQQRAVDSDAALKVVIAGPGSGKTRTMVEAVRVAQGRVAIMTFTNAGANEFRERLVKFKGTLLEARQLAYCGTLHGYCFRLIQRFGGFLAYIPGKVGILPDAERIPRLLAVRDKLGLKISQKAILERQVSTLVATGATADSVVEGTFLIWREYEFLLKRNNLVDYNGILSVALELLLMPEVRCQIKLDYLFVDEWQDSAITDQLIYEAIPAANKMYVGDADQSIFAFRGAHPMGLVHLARAVFDNSITDAEGFKLELNYRSDTMICEAADSLIAHNEERVDKMIAPVSRQPGHVGIVAFEDIGQELGFISSTILAEKNRDNGCREFAVLYRMNHDVKVCRDYLQAMGLPVQTPKFEQRPGDWEEAKLLLGLALAPTEILIERYLKLSYGSREVERWRLESLATGSAFIALARLVNLPEGSSTHEIQLYLAANGIGESTRYIIQARQELLGPDAELSDLLHDLHSNEITKEADSEGIYVGTIHSAKGREWDVVFLPAFEQGIIPSGKAIEKIMTTHYPTGQEFKAAAVGLIEEERRLAFVAVTRARHELYISHCAHRRGPWGPVGLGQPSQFIKEMGL